MKRSAQPQPPTFVTSGVHDEPAVIDCGPSPRDHFTIVPNHQLRNRQLSWAEKGMLAYIQSHHRGYGLTIAQIIAESTDGERAVRTIIAGLEAAGYVTRHRIRDTAGRLGRYRWRVNPDGGTQSGPDQGVHGEPAGQNQTALSRLDSPGWAAQPLEDQAPNGAFEEDQGKGEKHPPSPSNPKPPTYVGRCGRHGEHPNPPNCVPCKHARLAHEAAQPPAGQAVKCPVHLLNHPVGTECRSCRADRLAGEPPEHPTTVVA